MKWSGPTKQLPIFPDNHPTLSQLKAPTFILPVPVIALAFAIGAYFLLSHQLHLIISHVIQQSHLLSHVSDPPQTTEEAERVESILKVMADTETVWTELFQLHGTPYHHPQLAVYRDEIESSCGVAGRGGSFYCPVERKVYIDLDFQDYLRNEFGINGKFAQAYVIAHEVGHHIQNLIGYTQRINAAANEFRLDEAKQNALSVKKELQADCYAGVWAYYAYRSPKGMVSNQDIEEALLLAGAAGDDNLSAQQGHIETDTFTHGTSEQRVHWFSTGFETGDPQFCNTFQPAKKRLTHGG